MLTLLKGIAPRALPLAVLSFCLVTLKVVAKCDGPDMPRYGFPLAWVTPGANSLSWIVDVPAFAIDFGVYLFAWVLILLRVASRRNTSWWRSRRITAALWLLAILVGGFYTFVITIDWHAAGVTFDPLLSCPEVIRYAPHIGPPDWSG